MADATWLGFQSAIDDLNESSVVAFVQEVWEIRGFDTTVPDEHEHEKVDIVATPPDSGGTPQEILVVKRSLEEPIEEQLIEIVADDVLPTQRDPVVVTTGEFTAAARETAAGMELRLVDGRELFQLADNRRLVTLVSNTEERDDQNDVSPDTEQGREPDQPTTVTPDEFLSEQDPPVTEFTPYPTLRNQDGSTTDSPMLIGGIAGIFVYTSLVISAVLVAELSAGFVVVSLLVAVVVGRNVAPDDTRYPPIIGGILASLLAAIVLVPFHLAVMEEPAWIALLIAIALYGIYVVTTRKYPQFQ